MRKEPWASCGRPGKMAVIDDNGVFIAELLPAADEVKMAALLSAAPDLLKALENIVGDVDLRDEFEDAARAAIAKARGTA